MRFNCYSLIVPLLLPHLLDSIGQVHVGDLFWILKFEETITAVTSEIDENIAASVREKPLGSGGRWSQAASQHTDEILDCNLPILLLKQLIK